MSDEDDDFSLAINRHLAEWQRRHKEQVKLATGVIRMEGTAVWQSNAYGQVKQMYPEMARELNDELRKGFERLQVALPLPPDISADRVVTDISSFSVMTGNQAFETLLAIRRPDQIMDPGIVKSVFEYARMQEAEGRLDEAKRRLALVCPNLVERFVALEQKYRTTRSDPLTTESAALDMRTFIDKFYGELLEKARKHPGEKINLNLMADRLGADDEKVEILIEQTYSYKNLRNALSNIGKGRPSESSISDAWPRIVDLIFIVTGCVIVNEGGNIGGI